MTPLRIERGFEERERAAIVTLGFHQTGSSNSEPRVLLFERELAAP